MLGEKKERERERGREGEEGDLVKRTQLIKNKKRRESQRWRRTSGGGEAKDDKERNIKRETLTMI